MKIKDQQEQPLPESPAASLEYAGLSSIAAEEQQQQEQVEGQDEANQQKAAEAEHEDNLAGWRMAIERAADIIGAAIPEAVPVWNPARVEALAEALARCDAAYGWGGVGGLFSHPLVGLGFASVPLVIGTAKAINQAKARKPVDVQAREVKPGADPMAEAAGAPPAAA